MCLRQSYEQREITEIKWIFGGTNPADAMTKSKPCQVLKLLVNTNKLNLQVTEQVEQDQMMVYGLWTMLLGQKQNRNTLWTQNELEQII